MLLLIAQPVSGVTFETASYTQDDVRVSAVVQAELPWESPFTRAINLTIAIVPQVENVTEVSITEVIVSLHAEESGGDYLLISSKNHVFSEPVTDDVNATANLTVELSGTGTSEVCYFGKERMGYLNQHARAIACFLVSANSAPVLKAMEYLYAFLNY